VRGVLLVASQRHAAISSTCSATDVCTPGGDDFFDLDLTYRVQVDGQDRSGGGDGA
jgi:hypothetical protein